MQGVHTVRTDTASLVMMALDNGGLMISVGDERSPLGSGRTEIIFLSPAQVTGVRSWIAPSAVRAKSVFPE